VNRAARRLQGRVREREALHNSILLPLSVAITLNTEAPVPGLGALLYEIRAERGPDVMVGICGDCQTVEVVA
jgi:hypothetical protein